MDLSTLCHSALLMALWHYYSLWVRLCNLCSHWWAITKVVPLATALERLPEAYGTSQLGVAEPDHRRVFVKYFSNVQVVGEGHISGYKGLMQQLKILGFSRLNSWAILHHHLYFYLHIFSSDGTVLQCYFFKVSKLNTWNRDTVRNRNTTQAAKRPLPRDPPPPSDMTQCEKPWEKQNNANTSKRKKLNFLMYSEFYL